MKHLLDSIFKLADLEKTLQSAVKINLGEFSNYE